MNSDPKEVELTRSDVVVVQPQTEQVGFLPYFGKRVRKMGEIERLDLLEILAAIADCRASDEGRGITAVLRLWKEQTEVRSKFTGSRNLALYLAIPCLALVGLGSAGFPGAYAPAAVLFVLASLNASWYVKYLPVIRLYRDEIRQIREAAKTAVAVIASHQHLPRRLYQDDIKELRALSRGDEHFTNIASRIIDSAGR